jgi:hypothetical protein
MLRAKMVTWEAWRFERKDERNKARAFNEDTHHVADDGDELLNNLHRASVDTVAFGHLGLLHLAHKVRQYLREQT